MSKSIYSLIALFIVVASITVVATTFALSKYDKSTAGKVLTEDEQVEETIAVVEEADLIEIEPEPEDTEDQSAQVIATSDLPSDLDVTQRNEYLQSMINYDGISISVTDSGFEVSSDFVWSDDTYWFDVDPEGFARYSYLYQPNYGDDTFKVQASNSLNQWVGANTNITYCMTAALDTTESDGLVTWYVIFRDYPDVLVKATYNIDTGEYEYERLF